MFELRGVENMIAPERKIEWYLEYEITFNRAGLLGTSQVFLA